MVASLLNGARRGNVGLEVLVNVDNFSSTAIPIAAVGVDVCEEVAR